MGTENHGYNVPGQGTEDWHVPINENFEAFEVDIEVRDEGDPDANGYDPVEGAKYLDTNTGEIYIGDGSMWTLLGSLSGDGGSNWKEDGDLLEPIADTIVGVKIGQLTSPEDTGVTIETDDGHRILKLGVPSEDGFDTEAGGNIVTGHENNTVTNDAVGVVISGGGAEGDFENMVGGDYATIAGGLNNTASAPQTTVGGGRGHTASGDLSTIAGGLQNEASGPLATIAGGLQNEASSDDATVGGGLENSASADGATVAGGDNNEASARQATVAGGLRNEASSNDATVGGGLENTASADGATVAGGDNNEASGREATVGGGFENTASENRATVAGGVNNEASAENATVPGGANNTAEGEYSLAVGRQASAIHNGAMVFGDSSTTGVTSEGEEARFQMDIVTEGNLVEESARASKANIESIDPQEILGGVKSLDVSAWEYKDDDGEGDGRTHIGPMAEDFHATFGIGEETAISSVDRDGVALAAIKGLSAELDERDNRIEDLETENEALRKRLTAIESELGIDMAEPATADN